MYTKGDQKKKLWKNIHIFQDKKYKFYSIYSSVQNLEPHFSKRKNHFPRHKSFPERRKLLQSSPLAPLIFPWGNCCDLSGSKKVTLRRYCTRYLVYLLGFWVEFVSFEKEGVRDRRFSVVLPNLLSFKSLLPTKGGRNSLWDHLHFVQRVGPWIV